MKKLFTFLAILAVLASVAQGTDMVFENYDISPPPLMFLHADMDRIPGTDTYAVSATQRFPFYIIDGKSMEILQTFDVGNWYAGSRINLSATGKYILLKQLFYLDFAPNKDREVKFEVIEVLTGKRILEIPAAHDAALHPNEKELIVLSGDEVFSYPLDGSGKRSLFPVPAATNCIAISPDGSKIALSHHVDADFLNDYITKKRQKKNYKLYQKYRQCISVYDTGSFERLFTVDEMFDIPYMLAFSPDNAFLICYAVPHTKVVQKTGMTGSKYISKINSKNGETTTVGFVSNCLYEPDLEFSNDGNKIALVTDGVKYPEVWICDFNTGDIISRFEISRRLFQQVGPRDMAADAGRVGVAFSPDDSHLYFTNGTHIVKWKINYEDH